MDYEGERKEMDKKRMRLDRKHHVLIKKLQHVNYEYKLLFERALDLRAVEMGILSENEYMERYHGN